MCYCVYGGDKAQAKKTCEKICGFIRDYAWLIAMVVVHPPVALSFVLASHVTLEHI